MSNQRGKDLLQKIAQDISSEDNYELSKQDELEQYWLPNLDKYADIITDMYNPVVSQSGGRLVSIKNKILKVVSAITRTVMDKSIQKQVKYNIYNRKIITYLIEENAKLRKEIEQIRENK